MLGRDSEDFFTVGFDDFVNLHSKKPSIFRCSMSLGKSLTHGPLP
jgi:hypothetical protein